MTALIVQDFIGGELLLADVYNEDGSRQGVHYWNRLAGGLAVDLTREQLVASEVVEAPHVVERPRTSAGGGCTRSTWLSPLRFKQGSPLSSKRPGGLQRRLPVSGFVNAFTNSSS